MAAEDARDRDAAAAVVAGRGPDGPVARRIELAGDEPRRRGSRRRRAPCARRSSGSGRRRRRGSWRSTPVSSGGSTTCSGTSATARRERRCTSGRERGCERLVPAGRRRQRARRGRSSKGRRVRQGRQRDAALTEALHAASQRVGVDDPIGEAELALERLAVRVGDGHDWHVARRPDPRSLTDHAGSSATSSLFSGQVRSKPAVREASLPVGDTERKRFSSHHARCRRSCGCHTSRSRWRTARR